MSHRDETGMQRNERKKKTKQMNSVCENSWRKQRKINI